MYIAIAVQLYDYHAVTMNGEYRVAIATVLSFDAVDTHITSYMQLLHAHYKC